MFLSLDSFARLVFTHVVYDKYAVFENNICMKTFWQEYLLFEANIFLTLRQFRYKAIYKNYTLFVIKLSLRINNTSVHFNKVSPK